LNRAVSFLDESLVSKMSGKEDLEVVMNRKKTVHPKRTIVRTLRNQHTLRWSTSETVLSQRTQLHTNLRFPGAL
jgi:hypothetical protein